MNLSQLAFQGYLEKTGINIKEAEQLAQITRTPMQDYLQLIAEFRSIVGSTDSKPEAAKTLLYGSIFQENRDENFLFMKAIISVTSYQFGKEADFNTQISNFLNDENFKEYCSFIKEDDSLIQELKEQFIKSKTLGSRKGVWSKIFG
ncbi:hypothetical protein OAJ81_01360 [Gammaproteobacteria bacterium]|nr:hypothetical protein [Gammaproteobacteria bacterium]